MGSATTSAAHSAAGAYQGFTLQDVRLAFHLISAPAGCRVSIEHEDDVAVHFPDGRLLYEQIKSAPRSNPLADAARDLWKTLANWGNSTAKAGPSAKGNRFNLYVVPERAGVIATLINEAETDAHADAVIEAANELLAGSLGDAVAKQIRRFRGLPIWVQRFVIKNAAVESSGDPYVALHDRMGEGVTLTSAIVRVATSYIIGLGQTKARTMIGAGNPAILDADEFKRELQAFIVRTNMQRLLPTASEADSAKVGAYHTSRPTFVRQLELVQADRSQQLAAVADYLQASASKVAWAADGLVLSTGFERWDKLLLGAHSSYRMRVAAEYSSRLPEERGRILLADCSLHKEKLDADEVGQEFVRGSFHDLADRRKLGWHDDFDTLLDALT